ncbi:MAG: hypothetical protein HUJ52_01200 [Malacoplasma sp.]|nr:hypothetical protein [Malacoplasma sp.]
MTHTKIWGALIVATIAIALFLLILFGVSIKVSKTVSLYYDPSLNKDYVYVSLTNKQAKYVNEQGSNKKYSITNPIDKTDSELVKLYKVNNSDGTYLYDFKKPYTWFNKTMGACSTTFTFGEVKIFQYFIMF